jgi:hypothetical protein
MKLFLTGYIFGFGLAAYAAGAFTPALAHLAAVLQ